jgi:hypothetical protein
MLFFNNSSIPDYECHITVDANKDGANAIENIGRIHNWKTSYISGDPELGKGDRFFLTKHFNDKKYAMANVDVITLSLKSMGYKVVRKKVELIVADTKNGTWE